MVAFLRMGWRNDLGCGIKKLENTLTGSHGGLQYVVLFAQVLDRPEETLCVLHEGYKDAERDRSMQYAISATPDNESDGNGAKNFNRRIVQSVGKNRIFECVHMLL